MKSPIHQKTSVLRLKDYVNGVTTGDRVMLGRAITLIESRKPVHNRLALRVLEKILPLTGNSIRIGVTGIPGVGKSTFIEAIGTKLTAEGHRVAVLAIDPSSSLSGGSILGDKTRMEKLGTDPNAFIRPSPSAGTPGGVARKTREALYLCEAAGFDVVFIETVGVGQSETLVHSMVDFFLLLLLPGAGDSLQGIKRGIMELADAVVITKNDGDNRARARKAKEQFTHTVHAMMQQRPGWSPPVSVCSSVNGDGISDVWDTVLRYTRTMTQNGYLDSARRDQARAWMHETVDQLLESSFSRHPAVTALLPSLERAVSDGVLPPVVAAQKLVKSFLGKKAVLF